MYSTIPNQSVNGTESQDESVITIDDWFYARCQQWHYYDFHLRTTDNPGWRASFQLYTTETEAKSILATSLNPNDGVEVQVKNGRVRVDTNALSVCLRACAALITGTECRFMKAHVDVHEDEQVRKPDIPYDILPVNQEECVKIINNWFKACRVGCWEDFFRFRLTTAGDPAWMASFRLYMPETKATFILADILESNAAKMKVENGCVLIYSAPLSVCLPACAALMREERHPMTRSSEECTSPRIILAWIENNENQGVSPNGTSGKSISDLGLPSGLGIPENAKLLSDKTHVFYPNPVGSNAPSSTTVFLIHRLPIPLIEMRCPISGIGVYEQGRADQFVPINSSRCGFHHNKIALKSTVHEHGNHEIHYWLTIGGRENSTSSDSITAKSLKVVLQD